MFATIARYTRRSETILWWWGSKTLCEEKAEEARSYGCKWTKIVEIEEFTPVGTTADDMKVWAMLEARGIH